jgi:DNA-binding MarR family transcriptional regulator
LSRTSVTNIEKGRQKVLLHTLCGLAAALGVVPRSATGLVDALELAGLVERTVDPANRRAVLVTLTQRGLDMQEQMAQARRRAGDGIFGALDTSERRTLADLLQKLHPTS